MSKSNPTIYKVNTCSFDNNNTFSLALLYAEPYAKFLIGIIISFNHQKNPMKEEYFYILQMTNQGS